MMLLADSERVDLAQLRMSKLLALDQASHTSGYAIFIDGKLSTYGKFTFDDSDIGTRLTKIRNKVNQLIEDNNIDQVVMEDIQMQANVVNNVKTFKILAEVFGVIYELVSSKHLPCEAVLAASWKSTLGIKGSKRADQKRNAQLWVMETYDVKPTQDECDAICIGTHYLSHNKDDSDSFDWS